MAHRRRRQRSLPGHSDRHTPNDMDQLTFKYMEMCKMESSTESDSEISPRWSDTSPMGCVSSAPESGTSRRGLSLIHKPAGRRGCCSLFLDPYDGSSEESDESGIDVSVSSRQTRQQGKGVGGGGCRLSSRSRRFVFRHPASVALREVVKNGMRDSVTEQQNLLDVQIKCGNDSELWVCELDTLPSCSNRDSCGNLTEERGPDSTMHSQTMDVELPLDDSGFHGKRSSTFGTHRSQTPGNRSSSQMLCGSSERSPSSHDLRSIYKRKLGFTGAEMVELGQRKRQCVFSMEDQQTEKDSVSKPA